MKHIINKKIKSTYVLCILAFALGLLARYGVDTRNNRYTIEWESGVYAGDTLGGKPHGDGSLIRDGITYTGTWTNGLLTRGKIDSPEFVYNGEMADYKRSGYGVCRYKDSLMYWGYWEQGNRCGLGKMKDKEGYYTFAFFEDDNPLLVEGQNYKVGETVYGIDISHYQNKVKWQDTYICCNKDGRSTGKASVPVLYIQPVLFTYIKATEGASITDEMYEQNATEAKKYGIHTGAYHFLTQTASAKEQADNFIAHAKLAKGDMPPVLDLEKGGGAVPVDDTVFAQIIPIAKEWLKLVEAAYKTTPVIYTNMKIYDTFIKNDASFSKYPLWLASPGTQKPDVANCKIWQFSQHGTVNGVGSEFVDINLFDGDYNELLQFIGKYGIK